MGSGYSKANGSIKAIRINTGNGEYVSYRVQKNGYISDLENDNYRKSNISMKQIIDNAKKQGYSVQTYNQSQLNKYDKERAKEREKADKEITENYYRLARGASTMKKRGFVK